MVAISLSFRATFACFFLYKRRTNCVCAKRSRGRSAGGAVALALMPAAVGGGASSTMLYAYFVALAANTISVEGFRDGGGSRNNESRLCADGQRTLWGKDVEMCCHARCAACGQPGGVCKKLLDAKRKGYLNAARLCCNAPNNLAIERAMSGLPLECQHAGDISCFVRGASTLPRTGALYTVQGAEFQFDSPGRTRVGDYARTKEERERLDELARQDEHFWHQRPLAKEHVERAKRCVIGGIEPELEANPSRGKPVGSAVCGWDCYRRATMLEPLLTDVLTNSVPGDVVEAGVYMGGISIVLGSILRALGHLGESAGQRRLYMADSFAGLPPPRQYAQMMSSRLNVTQRIFRREHAVAKLWKEGEFKGSLSIVSTNVGRCMHLHETHGGTTTTNATSMSTSRTAAEQANSLPNAQLLAEGMHAQLPEGMHALVGFYNESLPGPIRRVALLRVDSDMCAAAPRLSMCLAPWPLATYK